MNKSVTQIKLIFVVSGEAFDPEEFTGLINVAPSEVWMEGEEIKANAPFRKSSVLPKRKESTWLYTEGFIETLDFDKLTNRFEEVFSSKAGLIKQFINQKRLDATINVVVEIADGQAPGLFLSKSFINLLHEMDLELDFDVYVLEQQ